MSLVALLSLAHAFAPREADGLSLEPHRPLSVHPLEQARLRGPAWEALQAELPGEWEVVYDQGNGTIHVLMGEGVPVAGADPAAVGAEVARLVADWAPRMGLGDGELVLASVSTVDRVATTYVDLELRHDGIPVVRGGVRARVKHGRLVMLLADLHGPTARTGDFLLTESAAVRAAIRQGLAPASDHQLLGAREVWLERSTLDGLRLRAAWEVRTRTTSPRGQWVAWVDATTGQLLHLTDEVRYASGTVRGRHHERTLNDPLIDSPLPLVVVTSGGDSDVTGVSGAYTVSGTATADLDGEYADIRNDAGGEAIVTGNGDLLFTTANGTQAEISTYVFVHQVRDWATEVAPEVDMIDVPLQGNVNISDVCNAFYDPYQNSVNFFVAGGGCSNTGQIADVVYHEWGHGFHLYSIQSGTWDGSVGEGAADTVATLITGDSEIGPTFLNNGSGIRDVAPDAVYPRDYSNSYYAVHSNGLIFGGSMWDLRGNLEDAFGATTGRDVVTDIFTGLLKGGPNIPDTYYEALVADDNDGNLANGTPHQCAIDEAFGRHGLGPGISGSAGVYAFHQPPEVVEAEAPFDVAVTAAPGSEECSGEITSGTIHYRVDGGGWQQRDGATVGDGIVASIPPQPMGSFIEYWAEVRTLDGAGIAPAQGEIAPYTAFVGGVLPIHCDDFEADDGGYVHELLAGDEGLGADDWMWGEPNGKGGDPATAASGDRVWGTDLGPDDYQGNDWNGQYQPGKTTRLQGPEIETGHYEGVFLHYQRWLHVEDAAFDKATVLVNGKAVWSNLDGGGELHTLDGQWMPHAVDLEGRADRGTAQISFKLASDEGLEFGGWTIDDVCLMAPATTDNKMGITDFEVEANDDGTVELSWTNPRWAPLERVVVVRNADDWPADRDDGDVVYDEIDPELGERVAALDENRTFVDGYYAVYGFDGEGWLSWTIEGWNADDVAGDDDIQELREVWEEEQAALAAEKQGGCGCTHGGPGVGAALLVGLLGPLRRRQGS